MAKIWIGTSGFTYKHWENIFYPQALPQNKWLEFYAKHFQAVEINASFYHQMSRKVFESWEEKTPENFIFAVKGSRFITHIKRLNDCGEPVKRFFDSASGLGKKLRVVLWQLPPRFKADPERLELFLKVLGKYQVRSAFEFREKSWLSPKIYAILKKYQSALVIGDSPDWPKAEVLTADFTYLRFHGHGSLYGSCYNKKELGAWASKMEGWGAKAEIYAFFNNDAHGYAVKNASELKNLLKRKE